jgi:hypothetical protein
MDNLKEDQNEKLKNEKSQIKSEKINYMKID